MNKEKEAGINHISEIIDVALNRMTKQAYANLLKVNPSTVSRNIAGDYERAIIHLKGKLEEAEGIAKELQEKANNLQESVKLSQSEAKQVQVQNKELQETTQLLQAEATRLQGENLKLKENLEALQGLHERTQSELARWNGQPAVIRRLASTDAKTAMLFLLAAFEGVGSYYLLEPKGVALAIPVSIALGFALLIFTASENRAGKIFCISFAVAVGAIYFQVVPDWSNYLFAFVPPAVAALLAFSFKRKNP